MKVKTKIKSRLVTQDMVLDFQGRIPAKGELIHADENGEGIKAVIEEVIWLHCGGSYEPWLIAKAYSLSETAALPAWGGT